MAIQGEGWEMRLLGYRVSGWPPESRTLAVNQRRDQFDLKQVAVEHARRLQRLGWRGVEVNRVTTEFGEESVEPVAFEETPA
jgi:hypothetical protein